MNRALAACLLLTSFLGGCLDFDAEDVTIRCDQEHDRIDVLLVYRGLYAHLSQGHPGDRVGKAVQDLDAAMQSGQFAFWCDWPFNVDLTEERSGPAAALLQHVEVENGGLFTDVKGTLCGYQFVRVNGAKAFLQKLNTVLEVRAQAMLAGNQEHKFEGTRELLRDFLRGGGRLLAVEPGRIELRMPCAAADHRWLKGQIEQYFLENAAAEMAHREAALRAAAQKGEEPGADLRPIDSVAIRGDQLHQRLQQAASFRFFWDNDFAFDRQPELTTITLGVRGDRELRIHKASDGAYGDDLKQALAARGDKFEAGVPDQELARRFHAFCDRDAVLPPKLAGVRKK